METLNTTTGKIIKFNALTGNHSLTNWIHESNDFKKHDGSDGYWFSADNDTIEWWENAFERETDLEVREQELSYTTTQLICAYEILGVDFNDLENWISQREKYLDLIEHLNHYAYDECVNQFIKNHSNEGFATDEEALDWCINYLELNIER